MSGREPVPYPQQELIKKRGDEDKYVSRTLDPFQPIIDWSVGMQVLFIIFAIASVCGAVAVITAKNPIFSAIFLILVLFCLAAIYVLLGAFFISIVQVMVYAGAIMVLFLFVIMLLNLKGLEEEESPSGGWGFAGFLVAVLLLVLSVPVFLALVMGAHPEETLEKSNTALIGELMFSDYILPFELASILLLAAIVGVVVLVKKTGRTV